MNWHRFRLFVSASMAVGITLLCPRPTPGLENSVIVESKTVMPGQDSVRVAIWINNADPIGQIALPLEIRSFSGGSFVRSRQVIEDNPSGRIHDSPLTSEEPGCWPFEWSNPETYFFSTPDSVNRYSGPVSQSYTYDSDPAQNPAFISPDAHLFFGQSVWCGYLAPGMDPNSPESASCYLLFGGVTSQPGQFEIDTCFAGAHLSFGGPSLSFTKGVITVLSCHADPHCDGIYDIIDVLWTVDRAFGGAPPLHDDWCPAPVDGRTDVDCSGETSLFDVVRMINVALRGADPAQLFCDPCN